MHTAMLATEESSPFSRLPCPPGVPRGDAAARGPRASGPGRRQRHFSRGRGRQRGQPRQRGQRQRRAASTARADGFPSHLLLPVQGAAAGGGRGVGAAGQALVGRCALQFAWLVSHTPASGSRCFWLVGRKRLRTYLLACEGCLLICLLTLLSGTHAVCCHGVFTVHHPPAAPQACAARAAATWRLGLRRGLLMMPSAPSATSTCTCRQVHGAGRGRVRFLWMGFGLRAARRLSVGGQSDGCQLGWEACRGHTPACHILDCACTAGGLNILRKASRSSIPKTRPPAPPAVECGCCPGRRACLHHASHLCGCEMRERRLVYRHSMRELEAICAGELQLKLGSGLGQQRGTWVLVLSLAAVTGVSTPLDAGAGGHLRR